MRRPGTINAMAVYDGRKAIGYIKPVEGGFHAWSARDIPLGTFPTREAALAAINSHMEDPALAR